VWSVEIQQWCFGGAYRLHLQGRKISWVRNQLGSLWKVEKKRRLTFCCACHLLSYWYLAWLILLPWRWRRYILPKRRLTVSWLHGVISQKIALFITYVYLINS
jgi:hypothetical protein